jgi:membrane glycosyltransferase
MPTPGSPSSHSSGESQPVNPYAAPSVASPRSAAEVERREDTPRTYQLRMEWTDRRRFLRAVGPLRLYAIAGFLLGGVAILSMIGAIFESRQIITFQGPADVFLAVRVLFVIAKGLLALYVCWLNWRFADALAATAGGTTSSMNEWSRLQLRLAQLLVATIALALASEGWELLVRYVLIDLLPSQRL